MLKNPIVFDESSNKLVGPLPKNIGHMVILEQLDASHNILISKILQSIYALPNLDNFTYSYNLFTIEAPNFLDLPSRSATFNNKRNCIPSKHEQRKLHQCLASLSRPGVDKNVRGKNLKYWAQLQMYRFTWKMDGGCTAFSMVFFSYKLKIQFSISGFQNLDLSFHSFSICVSCQKIPLLNSLIWKEFFLLYMNCASYSWVSVGNH